MTERLMMKNLLICFASGVMLFLGTFFLDVCGVTGLSLTYAQNVSKVSSPTDMNAGLETTVPPLPAGKEATADSNAVQSSPPGLPGATGTSSLTGVPPPLQPLSYDPSSRRDPFAALVGSDKKGNVKKTRLPPLQQVGLTELNIIGVLWGGFGFTAMVQTPDGKGYSVRRGTLVGPNDGVVTSITKNGIVVTERFTDIYGRKQEREHIKLLHADEEFE